MNWPKKHLAFFVSRQNPESGSKYLSQGFISLAFGVLYKYKQLTAGIIILVEVKNSRLVVVCVYAYAPLRKWKVSDNSFWEFISQMR